MFKEKKSWIKKTYQTHFNNNPTFEVINNDLFRTYQSVFLLVQIINEIYSWIFLFQTMNNTVSNTTKTIVEIVF